MVKPDILLLLCNLQKDFYIMTCNSMIVVLALNTKKIWSKNIYQVSHKQDLATFFWPLNPVFSFLLFLSYQVQTSRQHGLFIEDFWNKKNYNQWCIFYNRKWCLKHASVIFKLDLLWSHTSLYTLSHW